MPVDPRLDLRKFAEAFANSTNVFLRQRVDAFARRIQDLLGGTTTDVTAPAAPTGLTAVAGEESVILDWADSTETDLLHYTVYRSTTSGSGMASIGVYYDSTITDTGLSVGIPYYYEVTATDTSGNESSASSEVTATPTASTSAVVPATPTGLTATAGDGYVDLSWTNGGSTIIGTNIHRSTTSGSGFARIASAIPGTTYRDTKAVNGTTYYYIIYNVTANNIESTKSDEASATPAAVVDTTPPPVPVITAFAAGDSGAALTIQPVAAPDLAGYRVYQGTAPGGPYTLYRGTTTLTQIRVVALTNGTQYYFVCRSIDTTGNESANSNEVTLTPAAVVDVTPPAAPQNFMITDEVSTSISLAWNANTEGDMASYRVYISEPPMGSVSGPWTLEATIGVGIEVATITGLTAGETYYFYLTAVDASGNESDPSTIISGNTPTFGGPGGSAGGGTGTGKGGQISGDTGLGGTHRAPGAMFDHVVDVSSYTGSGHAIVYASAAARAYVSNNGGNSAFVDKSVAILLPERTDNGELRIANGSFLGGTHAEFPNISGVEWHFIGPWPTATLTDPLLTAKAAQKKYVLTFNDANGDAVGGWSTGGATCTIGFRTAVDNYRIGFWCMEFQAGGVSTLNGYDPGPNRLNNGNNLTLFLTDFAQDYNFTAPTGALYLATPAGGGLPQSQARAFPRWTIELNYMNLDVMKYCTIDGPWNWEHGVYNRQAQPGDKVWEYTDFLRTGGQAFQFSLRSNADGGQDPTGGVEAGTVYVRNCLFKHNCRSYWSTANTSHYGHHFHVVFEDCDFVQTQTGRHDNSSVSQSWPPADPYQNNLNFATSDNANTTVVTDNGAVNGNHFLSDGHVNVGWTARRCNFYNYTMNDYMFRFNHCRTIVFEDCGVFIPTSESDLRGVILGLARDNCQAEFLVDSFTWTNCCTSAQATAFSAAHTEVPSAGSLKAVTIYRHNPPQYNSGSRTTVGVGTSDFNLTNI